MRADPPLGEASGPAWVRAAVFALPVAISGCAVSASLTGGANVDTTGHFGTEERLQLSAAAGSPDLRFFVSLAGGAGYLDGPATGFATVSPEVGVEGGTEVQWSGGLVYAPRFLFEGPLDVAHGGGASGHVLFRLKRTGGESGSLLLGPRLSIEAVGREPAGAGTPGAVGLFQLGVVLRWITFDTTGKSWTN